jgi:hypothetical protein
MNLVSKILLSGLTAILFAIFLFAAPLPARALDVNIGLGEPPIYYPQTDIVNVPGYYITNDRRYYHYDPDRRGWYYGRTNDEGLREESHRQIMVKNGQKYVLKNNRWIIVKSK